MRKSRLFLKLKYLERYLPDNISESETFIEEVEHHIAEVQSPDYEELVFGVKETVLEWCGDYLEKLTDNHAELQLLIELQDDQETSCIRK